MRISTICIILLVCSLSHAEDAESILMLDNHIPEAHETCLYLGDGWEDGGVLSVMVNDSVLISGRMGRDILNEIAIGGAVPVARFTSSNNQFIRVTLNEKDVLSVRLFDDDSGSIAKKYWILGYREGEKDGQSVVHLTFADRMLLE